MVFTDIFFPMGTKHLCGSIPHLYIYCWDILYTIFTHLYRYCFTKTRMDHNRAEFSFGQWNTWLELAPLWKRMSQIVVEKTRHYLISDSMQYFLVVIYNPQFPLVDQRHEMCFWPIVCFPEPAGRASFRMVTPYAFKVFNLYYHNEIPWLSKSLWQFTGAKQKVVFICIASPHAHPSEQSWISIAWCWTLSSVSVQASNWHHPSQSKGRWRHSAHLSCVKQNKAEAVTVTTILAESASYWFGCLWPGVFSSTELLGKMTFFSLLARKVTVVESPCK